MELLKKAGNFLYKRFISDLTDEERKEIDEEIRTGKPLSKKTFMRNLKGAPLILSPFKSIEETIKGKIKSGTIETIENLAKGRFKYYGKWAGPSYSAGRFYDKDEIITKEDIDKNQPDDELDALTLKHDLRYQLGATKQTQEQRAKALRDADELFINEAENLLNTKQLDIKQKIATKAAILAFKAKLATNLGYNIDKLPDDKIKEAEEVVNNYFNITKPEPLRYENFIPIEENNLVFSGQDENNIDLSEPITPQIEQLAEENILEKLTQEDKILLYDLVKDLLED
jgi:hypothetical protein